MKVQILIDNINSFYLPYAYKLKNKLEKKNITISIVHNHSDVVKGDVLCLVGCEKIFKKLDLNKSNIIVHESRLPDGKAGLHYHGKYLKEKVKFLLHFLKLIKILILEKFIFKKQ